MGDIKKRMATVRARRFNKYGDSTWNLASLVALGKAKEYFGTDNAQFLAQAMAEVLFGHQARGRAKGIKTWTDNRLLHLAFAYTEIKWAQPSLSDTKIAALLCAHPDFKSDPENLRQRFGKAKREYERWAEHEAAEYVDEDRREEWEAEQRDAATDDD